MAYNKATKIIFVANVVDSEFNDMENEVGNKLYCVFETLGRQSPKKGIIATWWTFKTLYPDHKIVTLTSGLRYNWDKKAFTYYGEITELPLKLFASVCKINGRYPERILNDNGDDTYPLVYPVSKGIKKQVTTENSHWYDYETIEVHRYDMYYSVTGTFMINENL